MFAGKPLIAHTIDAAKESGIFDDIIVSTDSIKYKEIAQDYGVDIPFLRTENNSSDHASTWDVVKEVLYNYVKMGKEFDTVAILQPTSPLRSKDDIIEAFNVFTNKKADFVASVCETDHSPYLQNTLGEDNSLSDFLKSEIVSLPRQKFAKFYRLNGAIYIVKANYLLEGKPLYKENSFAYIMEKNKSIDIDTEYDFFIAEFLFNKIK